MSGAPSLHVVIEFEGKPRLYLDALTEGEEQRLVDWLTATPEAREFLELAERWQEAM
jgi:hypothetical protein